MPNPGPNTFPGSSDYFAPNTVEMTAIMNGTLSLRYSYPQGTCVYKDVNGNWQAKLVVYQGDLDVAEEILTYGEPVEITDPTLEAALLAAGVGTTSSVELYPGAAP